MSARVHEPTIRRQSAIAFAAVPTEDTRSISANLIRVPVEVRDKTGRVERIGRH